MSEKKLTKGDRFNMFMRTNLQQASFNYERMHALGMCFDMVPAIKRLYDTKEEQVAALKRHLTFFNVTPAAVGPVLGVTAAMEEAKANGADIDEGTIGSIKIGLMGPFCGVGDPIFWGTLRPITAAIGASLALTGSALGPVLFFLAVMGALVSKWTTINVPLVVSRVTTNGKTTVTTVQNILDQLLPGLLALVLTLVVSKLLKKNISPIAIIFILFAVGIVGYGLGILA